MTRTLLSILLAALLAGCGGGDEPAPDHYILVMETVDRQPFFVSVYETEADCIGAGSYRLSVFPDKFRGYACKAA